MLKRRITTILLLSSVLLFAAPQVFAQEPTPPSNEDIAQRCQVAINYVTSNQKPRDLRSRVDYLQAYQYIYQRFDIFVRRLERNNQKDAPAFRATLTELQKETDQFKQAYESYDTARESLTGMTNCSTNPDEFSRRLAEARQKRVEVNNATNQVNTHLSATLQPQLQTLYGELTVPTTKKVTN